MAVYGVPKTAFILLRSAVVKTQNRHLLLPDRMTPKQSIWVGLMYFFLSKTTTSKPSDCILVSKMVALSQMVQQQAMFSPSTNVVWQKTDISLILAIGTYFNVTNITISKLPGI